MKILIALILSTLPFASFVQALELHKKVGYSVSAISGTTSYVATGTVKTQTNSLGGFSSASGGTYTTGYVSKNQLEVLTVKQSGNSTFSGGSATLYASVEFARIKAGGSVTAASESSKSHDYDNSIIENNGTDIAEGVVFAPGSITGYREVVITDTRVELDNYTKTESNGGWLSSTVYVK